MFTAIVQTVEGLEVEDDSSGAVELINSAALLLAVNSVEKGKGSQSNRGPKPKDKDHKDMIIGKYLSSCVIPVSSDEEGDCSSIDDGDSEGEMKESAEMMEGRENNRGGDVPTNKRRRSELKLKYSRVHSSAMADPLSLPWPIR